MTADRAADLDALVDRANAAHRAALAATRAADEAGRAALPSFTCNRCGVIFTAATAPYQCPRCGYEKWNEPRESRTCARCGHSWTVLVGHPHGKCPACRSRLWDATPLRSKGKPD